MPNVCVCSNTQSAGVRDGQDGASDFVECAPDSCESYPDGPQFFKSSASGPQSKNACEMHRGAVEMTAPWVRPAPRNDNSGPNAPPRGREDHPGYPPVEGNFYCQNRSVPQSFYSIYATYAHAFSSDSCVGAATPSLRETPYYHPMVVNTPYAAPSAPLVEPFGRLTANG